MKNNIKALYQQIADKSNAINQVALATGRSFNGVKNHWLCDSGGWSIPDEQVSKVTDILQKIIKNQNDTEVNEPQTL